MDTIHFRQIIWEKGQELFRDMPWRRTTSGYLILVSELMLQQTQVDRVVPKYNAFVARFPDINTLADASLADVLRHWQGLGYNRRAKYLHDAAVKIVHDYNGRLPDTSENLMNLPGVGENTAGALLAYVYNLPAIFIETNIRTVYFFHFFNQQQMVTDKELRLLIAATLDYNNPREFYWALMDYGAWLKKQKMASISQSAHYKKQSQFKGSLREMRGEIIRSLSLGGASFVQLQALMSYDGRLGQALSGLVRDGLIDQNGHSYYLTGSPR